MVCMLYIFKLFKYILDLIYIYMNLYKKLLEKENKEKENRKELQKIKQRQRSLDYYYRNREYILLRQQKKKYYNKEYYKQWYDKNKDIVNSKRRNKIGAEKRVNKEYEKKQFNNNNIPISFTINFN